MKNIQSCLTVFLFLVSSYALKAQHHTQSMELSALSLQLAQKDSLLFDIAFHTGKLQKLPEIVSKDFVMLHDNGLLKPTTAQSLTSFKQFLKETAARQHKGFARMRRTIVKGSLQVFRISSNDAVQTGIQQFFVQTQETGEIMVEESKFLRNWKKEGSKWKISSETDFLVNSKPRKSASLSYIPEPYVSESGSLYQTIVNMDSIYFDTYNHSNLAKMDSLTSTDIEFYHDRGGLSVSKSGLLEAMKTNIFGKVTRTRVAGSLEVYPIPGYGAVEFGYHYFHNLVEKSESKPSKFVIIWRLKDNAWQITRVISLH